MINQNYISEGMEFKVKGESSIYAFLSDQKILPVMLYECEIFFYFEYLRTK